eukprot:sb/3477860/
MAHLCLINRECFQDSPIVPELCQHQLIIPDSKRTAGIPVITTNHLLTLHYSLYIPIQHPTFCRNFRGSLSRGTAVAVADSEHVVVLVVLKGRFVYIHPSGTISEG